MITRLKIIRTLFVTALILTVPLVVMQFSEEVDWDFMDFAIMGTLLIGTGLAYEFTASRMNNPRHRAVTAVILLVTFLLVWAELAVGVFGSPFAGS